MGMMTRRNVKARPIVVEKPLEKPLDNPVEKAVEKPVEKKAAEVTKEEVEKMAYFGLKSLATKHGIDVDGKKAAKLKEEIIEKLNL